MKQGQVLVVERRFRRKGCRWFPISAWTDKQEAQRDLREWRFNTDRYQWRVRKYVPVK